jgi:hypothetical protein
MAALSIETLAAMSFLLRLSASDLSETSEALKTTVAARKPPPTQRIA